MLATRLSSGVTDAQVWGLALWPDALKTFEDAGVPVRYASHYLDAAAHMRLYEHVAGWVSVCAGLVREFCPGCLVDGLDLAANLEFELEVLFTAALFDAGVVRAAIDELRPDTVELCEPAPWSLPGSAWSLQRIGLRISPKQIAEESSAAAGALLRICPLDGDRPVPSQRGSRFWRLREVAFVLYNRVLAPPRPVLPRRARSLAVARFPKLFHLVDRRLVVLEGRERGKGLLLPVLERCGFTCIHSAHAGALVRRLRRERWMVPLQDVAMPDEETLRTRVAAEARALGVDDAPSLRNFAVAALRATLEAHLPVIVGQYKAMRLFAERYRPALYLTAFDSTLWHRATAWAFHTAGVPCVLMPHGLGTPNGAIWPAERSGYWLDGPNDEWCISDRYADALIKFGDVPADRVATTGTLDMWILSRPRWPSRLSRRLLRIPEGARVVLYATTCGDRGGARALAEETAFEMWDSTRQVIAACAGMENVVLIVKLHPGVMRTAQFEGLCQAAPNVVLTRDVPLQEVLALARVMVCYHSSTGIEALWRGVPLVIYNTTGRPSFLTPIAERLDGGESWERKLAIWATDEESLRIGISQLLEQSPLRQRLEENRERFLAGWLANAEPTHDPVMRALDRLRSLGIAI